MGEGIRDDGVTAEVTEAWLLVRSVLGAIIIVIIQIIIRVRSQHSQQCLPVCSVTRLTQAARHSSSQYSVCPDWPRLLYPRLTQLTVSNKHPRIPVFPELCFCSPPTCPNKTRTPHPDAAVQHSHSVHFKL